MDESFSIKLTKGALSNPLRIVEGDVNTETSEADALAESFMVLRRLMSMFRCQ